MKRERLLRILYDARQLPVDVAFIFNSERYERRVDMPGTRMTFEHLYMALDPRYDRRRAAKVQAIASYLRGRVKIDPTRAAEYVMSGAEEMGRFSGNSVSGEIPGRWTVSGHPLTVSV